METNGSFYYALDEEGNKRPPTPGLRASCPCCGTEVYAACGKIIKHHWRHKNTSDSHCDDWYEMTVWHLKWQELFPLECREVVIQKDDKKHRADVKIDNLIIEFQHSNLSNHKVKERELFYGSEDNKIIWIVDATEDRIWNAWKNNLEFRPIKPVFLVDKKSNIYSQLNGYIGVLVARNVEKLPAGLVINPTYPTFVDLGEYIASPLEKSIYDMDRTTYMKKWGHRKWSGALAQEFILVQKNDFVKALYDIPTKIDIFDSIKLCDEQTLDERKKRLEIAKIEKEKTINTLKTDKKFARFTVEQLEQTYAEQMKSRHFKKSLILETVVDEDIYEENKDFEEAIANYTQAIQINPHDAEGYYGRGVLREALKYYEEAIADYTQAAILFKQQGDMEKYEEVLQRIE